MISICGEMRYRPVMDTPHKARVAQAQHRHQTHQVSGQIINILNRQRFAFAIDKAPQGHHAVVIGELAFQTIEHPMITIVTRYPAALKRTKTPDPMAPRFGFTEGQDNMQMVLAPPGCRPGKPEVIAYKVIKIELRGQKQGQRIKQTGLPTRFSPIRTLFCSSINDKRLIPRKPTISTRSRSISPPLNHHSPSVINSIARATAR